MGMESDNHSVMSLEEQREQERLEKELANAKKEPLYTIIGCFVDKKKKKSYQLLVRDIDRRFFKREQIGTVRFDKMNMTPEVAVYSEKLIPCTKEDRIFN